MGNELSQAPSGPEPEVMTSDQRMMAVLCHASLFLGVGIILPLIVYLVKRKDDPLVTEHAQEALNFHLSFLIWSALCVPLIFIVIGIPLFFAIILTEFILAIIGTIKAADDRHYQYPLTIRFIR